jgi:hypothetical protein
MVLFWLSLVLRGEGLERGLNFAPKANELEASEAVANLEARSDLDSTGFVIWFTAC